MKEKRDYAALFNGVAIDPACINIGRLERTRNQT